MRLFITLLPYVQFFCFIMFVFGAGKYSIRNKIFFIYPGMKHPKATRSEMFLCVFGLSFFVISMILRGILRV